LPEPKTKKSRLPRLTNEQYDQAATIARKSGVPLNQCPTCLAREIEVDEGTYGWENGTYRYKGDEHLCDCDWQMQLRKHYLLANIGDQYQRLNWDDFNGSEAVKDAVAIYLEKWNRAKLNGMGMEFSSPNLGVGKTFAATHVGKELVKRGEAVFFLPFLEVIGLLSRETDIRQSLNNRLRDTTVLILDEVVPAISVAQHALFSRQFEELIRHRTNFNRVTIMTTNLKPQELHEQYPRTYSLLEAKQIRVEMSGGDARQTFIAHENLELMANDEVRPIT
jgi:DNA replication protein DnaC